MRRGVIDTLRRGLDNTVANWPLVLVRLAETVLFIALAIGAVLVIVLPILVSAGIDLATMDERDEIEGAMLALMNRWMMLVWIFLGVSVLLLLFVAVHAFVEAGAARIYVDGEKIAGAALEGDRNRYRVFSLERWLAGGRDGWWPVFWIYNVAWGLLGLFLLIPLIPTVLLMLVFHESAPAVAALSGCFGVIAMLMLLLVGGIATGIWTNRAIVEWATRRTGAREALAASWRAIRSDFARHLLVALALIVVAFAGSTFFASFSFFAGFAEAMGNSEIFLLVTLPIRLLASVVSSAFSAFITGWYVAAYAALAVERP